MKKSRIIPLIVAGAFLPLIFSCASSPKTDSSKQTNDVSEKQQKKKPIKLVELQQTVSTEDSNFESMLKDVKLEMVSSPKFTTAGRKFSAPFILSVKSNSQPLADFEISVSYPSDKADDVLSFSVINLKTDSNGKISWTPDIQTFSVNDNVTFYPTPSSSSAFAKQKAFEVAVTAPYKIRSSYTTSMGVLYAYNINEKGIATGNNFELLQNLRTTYGINIGNSPIGEPTYVNKDIADLYKATYAIVGNAYKFMISGFFRYAEPATENENGVTVKLTADINCIDMKSGNLIFKTSITETTTDKNKWTAEQKCKAALAEKAAEAIVYGM